MIVTVGGIKGGVGKTTIAINLAIMRVSDGQNVLFIDADNQETSSLFTARRKEVYRGSSGYHSVQLAGSELRVETLKLAKHFDDIIIDAGGKDTAAQRAALTISDTLLIPFQPSSFDVWTLAKVSNLVKEAKKFNENIDVYGFLNQADARGTDNLDALEVAKSFKNIRILDTMVVCRKVFRKAGDRGQAVVEFRPKCKKAEIEIQGLYDAVFAA